jgi:ribosomal protein S18 acetylase RimI-like enzyme
MKPKNRIIMPKNINLVPVTINDLQFGYELWKLTQKEFLIKIKGEWIDEQEIEFYMDETKTNIENNYLLNYNGITIGWLEYEIFKDYIFINQLHILPEHQGKGIGTKILNEIIKYGKKFKKNIYLEVLQNNDKGLEYYNKLGFKKYRESSLFNSLEYVI